MVYIYTLKLENGKYYIGKTSNPHIRLNSHFNSNGSEWTKKYKPLKVIDIKSNCDSYDEDKITRQYMDKYGIDNVRGGSFSSVNLNESTINILNRMSNGTNDKCFKCGGIGHFAKQCKSFINKTDKLSNDYNSECDDENYDSEYDNDYDSECDDANYDSEYDDDYDSECNDNDDLFNELFYNQENYDSEYDD